MVKDANLLVHVVDAASAIPEMHISTVHEILEQIESNVEEILVFNKIDKIDKPSLNFLQEKYESAIFVSSLKQVNLDNLISEITYKIFGNLIEVKLLTSPLHLDSLHKFSTIKNVINKEDQLEVDVSIRNYYLNNLVEKEVVKILS